MLKFTAEKEENLLLLVENAPSLWNLKSSNYKRNDIKGQLWIEIAGAFGCTCKFTYFY